MRLVRVVWAVMGPLLLIIASADAATPARTSIEPPLPAGPIEAGFDIDAGGATQGSPQRSAKLLLVIRRGGAETRRTLFRCRYAGHGSAMTSGRPDELDAAVCDDDELTLSTRPRRLDRTPPSPASARHGTTLSPCPAGVSAVPPSPSR